MNKCNLNVYNLSKGIELIKKYEGCKLEAYLCPANVWTIGYGYTHNVKEGDIITQEQANILLENEVLEVATKLYKKTIHYELNNNQFNAFLSFFYNLGFNNGVSERFENGAKINEIIESIKLYVKVGGKPLSGLITRREQEYNLAKELNLWH